MPPRPLAGVRQRLGLLDERGRAVLADLLESGGQRGPHRFHAVPLRHRQDLDALDVASGIGDAVPHALEAGYDIHAIDANRAVSLRARHEK